MTIFLVNKKLLLGLFDTKLV